MAPEVAVDEVGDVDAGEEGEGGVDPPRKFDEVVEDLLGSYIEVPRQEEYDIVCSGEVVEDADVMAVEQF